MSEKTVCRYGMYICNRSIRMLRIGGRCYLHTRGSWIMVPSNCMFLRCVDEALNVFGESVRQTIYFYLNHNYYLARDTIPVRVNAFEEALEAIFSEGARTILRLIIKNVYSKVGLNCPPQMYHLTNLRNIKGKLSEICRMQGVDCTLTECIRFEGENCGEP